MLEAILLLLSIGSCALLLIAFWGDQKFGGHLSEAVGGAGYEDARHSVILLLGRLSGKSSRQAPKVI